jgi:hypothetical protein
MLTSSVTRILLKRYYHEMLSHIKQNDCREETKKKERELALKAALESQKVIK